MVVVIGIVTNEGSVRKTKHCSLLHTDSNTSSYLSGAVALTPLVGVCVSLNGCAKLLSRSDRQILDVVSPQISSFCTGRRLGNSGQAVPSNTGNVFLSGRAVRIQNTTVSTGLIESIAGLVPFQ